MSFEKAKDVVAMNTPGVDEISDSIDHLLVMQFYERLGHASVNSDNIKRISFERALRNMKKEASALERMGAITDESTRKFKKWYDEMWDAMNEGNVDYIFNRYNNFDHIIHSVFLEDISRWARAPKAVGTKREVIE